MVRATVCHCVDRHQPNNNIYRGPSLGPFTHYCVYVFHVRTFNSSTLLYGHRLRDLQHCLINDFVIVFLQSHTDDVR